MIVLEDLLAKASELTGNNFRVQKGVCSDQYYLIEIVDLGYDILEFRFLKASAFKDGIIQYLLDLLITEEELQRA